MTYLEFWLKPFIEDLHLLKERRIWLFMKRMKLIIISFSIILILSYFEKVWYNTIILILSFLVGFTLTRHNMWNEYKNGRK